MSSSYPEHASTPPGGATATGSAASDTRRAETKPLYERAKRIEGRIWSHQLAGLTNLRIELDDRRTDVPGDRERFTNNTLLRVALEILLEHKDALKGNTEAELTEALRQHLRSNSS